MSWSNKLRALLVGGRIRRSHPWFHTIKRAVFVFRPSDEATRVSGFTAALDPDGKIAEVKFCAVRVSPA